MHILAHTITTKDAIAAQAGLLAPRQLMGHLGLTAGINQTLASPEGNRGFARCLYMQTMMLRLYAGAECLEHVRHRREDRVLLGILHSKLFATAGALGHW